jgi:hypothetical protein
MRSFAGIPLNFQLLRISTTANRHFHLGPGGSNSLHGTVESGSGMKLR